MVPLFIIYFGIISTVQVASGIPWNAKPAARYAGYDLERGPVLYEAYYPEDQDPVRESPAIRQEKRYFDRSVVPERSYQIPLDPYEINSFHPEASAESSEDYLRLNSPGISASSVSGFAGSRPGGTEGQLVAADEDRPNDEYIFGEQPMRINREPIRNPFESSLGNDYSYARSQSIGNVYGDRYRDDQRFVGNNEMGFGDANEVQRIVPINDEFIFGEKPADDEVAKNRFPEPLRNFNEKESSETRHLLNPVYDRQQRNEIQSPLEIENIFAPRPQVINYVFSKPIMETEQPRNPPPEIEDNDWPRNYGDNLIQGEIKRADEQELRKQEEAKVTSIEVSQVPRHKIRHHHGELPKRNYAHN